MTSNALRAVLSVRPTDEARRGPTAGFRSTAGNLLSFERLRVAVFFQSLASGLVLLWAAPVDGDLARRGTGGLGSPSSGREFGGVRGSYQ
jgi:hypothetical protein